MEINALLINESQLGTQLNNCVHEKRRNDFSLMLAMLSQDVLDFGEFHQNEGNRLVTEQEGSLRAFFDLPEPEQLALKSMEQISTFNQAKLVESELFDDIRLTQCISAKPLSFRDDEKFIPTKIKTNLSLCQQQRLENKDDMSIAKPQNTHVASWLKSVNSAMTKAASISLHSIA